MVTYETIMPQYQSLVFDQGLRLDTGSYDLIIIIIGGQCNCKVQEWYPMKL